MLKKIYYRYAIYFIVSGVWSFIQTKIYFAKGLIDRDRWDATLFMMNLLLSPSLIIIFIITYFLKYSIKYLEIALGVLVVFQFIVPFFRSIEVTWIIVSQLLVVILYLLIAFFDLEKKI